MAGLKRFQPQSVDFGAHDALVGVAFTAARKNSCLISRCPPNAGWTPVRLAACAAGAASAKWAAR